MTSKNKEFREKLKENLNDPSKYEILKNWKSDRKARKAEVSKLSPGDSANKELGSPLKSTSGAQPYTSAKEMRK